jgi:hypothetical protein
VRGANFHQALLRISEGILADHFAVCDREEPDAVLNKFMIRGVEAEASISERFQHFPLNANFLRIRGLFPGKPRAPKPDMSKVSIPLASEDKLR